MGKKLNEKILYVVAFIAIFLVPTLLFYYFGSKDDEIFHRRVVEDNEICRQRTITDSRETVWCDEIKKAATLTYSAGKNSSNFYLLLVMFQPLLFLLLISLYNLRKQVEELKEKTDV